MSAGFSFSCFTSLFYLLLFVAVFRLCLSINNGNDALCNDDERQALVEFKHGLIDEAGRLASWVGEKSDCCKWAGIFCDNITGHVHKIHLPAKCRIGDFDTIKEYEFFQKQRLRGDLSPSLLHLKHLKHLDLSCNDFGGTKVPSFMGSLGSLRYLNLSRSRFHGSIPSQLGNLSELRVLSLGSFYDDETDEYESTDMRNIEWLSSLRWLHHLDMSGVDLSKAIDWLQVINTLPSLFHLYMSRCQLSDIHPHVYSLNLTSVTSLFLSRNNFNNSLVPRWIFSISSLVSLDLSWCHLSGPVPSGSGSFYNLTSLKLLHVPGNNIMNSSLVFEEISSSVGGSLISLDISSCGVLSLDSLHNMTSLLNLQMYGNQLTKKVPLSLGNLCNLRHIDLGGNNFRNISLKCLLESFFKCKSPSLEYLFLESSGLSSHLPDELGQMIKLVLLQLGNNNIASAIPDSIGGLSFLKYLLLDENLISGPVPYSIGGLSSLEVLDLSNNRLNGSLPESLGLLSNLDNLDLSHNFLSGVVTKAHFANLNKLKYLNGRGNNLTLRPLLANWIPSFQLVSLELTSWDLGPGFPLWLLQQRELVLLDMSNTRISSTMPLSFWSSLPNLQYLDMSQNNIQGRLFGIPAMLSVLDLSSNRFSGQLPQLSKSSLSYILDLSNNSFIGSLHHLICPYDGKWMEALNLANNHLSGVIPECWEKYMDLNFLNLENNNLSGGIPRNLGSLSSLES